MAAAMRDAPMAAGQLAMGAPLMPRTDAAPRATLAFRTTLGLPLTLSLANFWRAFYSRARVLEVIQRRASSSFSSSEASAIAAARSLGT